MHKQYELIGSDICPYVHRTQIVLKLASVDHKVTYIDLQNKPTWFLETSPTGKVPVLRVGSEVLFESSAINEYINAITQAGLLPTEPLAQAQNRAWIEYGSGLLMTFYQLLRDTSPDTIKSHQAKFSDDLSHLENQLKSNSPYFNGDRFALIDAAYAPLFKRVAIVAKHGSLDFLAASPKIKGWSDHLCQDKRIEAIYAPDYEEKFINGLLNAEGYFASLYHPKSGS